MSVFASDDRPLEATLMCNFLATWDRALGRDIRIFPCIGKFDEERRAGGLACAAEPQCAREEAPPCALALPPASSHTRSSRSLALSTSIGSQRALSVTAEPHHTSAG